MRSNNHLAKLILAITVPLSFLGVLISKAFNENAAIDATIAGGLIAILGTIVAGIFNNTGGKNNDDV